MMSLWQPIKFNKNGERQNGVQCKRSSCRCPGVNQIDFFDKYFWGDDNCYIEEYLGHRGAEVNDYIAKYKEIGKDYDNPDVLDGTSWDVTIKYNDGKKWKSGGCNAFPYNFSGFLDIMGMSE